MAHLKVGIGIVLIALFICGQRPSNAAQQTSKERKPITAGNVDQSRLYAADLEPGNWMTHGRTFSEQRFSPLNAINAGNVSKLGLAWYYDLDTDRGQEATPIVVDGVMYFTSAWSKVFAVNAATGALIWSYDPKVPPETGVNACCDVVNRGVAVWEGKIFSATLDGRLIALDAATGKLIWQVLTIDPNFRYTITGAPRVAAGRVFIGNGGAEMGVRGYVSAYDVNSGKQLWRFYTVPGDPSKPFENDAMARAAKTWTGEWWKYGGGGTVWDSIVYDPDLDLLYLGVGNGSPWDWRVRSPKGGDNLFLSSIVALKPETGAYVWHYQETPGEMWDYTAAQQITLADVQIDGKERKVILHAPKNGFFYCIDRTSGALISAKPYTAINWATGVDMKTGRPVETGIARYPGENPAPVVPGPLGAHNWQPMAYSPNTGLVYIPVQDIAFIYKSEAHFEPKKLAANYGIDLLAAELPQNPMIKKIVMDSIKGRLLAWDPIQQKPVWTVERPGPWNGGILATAGNLVFEGTASGNFEAYRADTGEKVWSFAAQTGVMAGPVAFAVDGQEYIAVLAGWGGAFPLATGEVSFKSGHVKNISRMLVFKIGGGATLPSPPAPQELALNPPPSTASIEVVKHGEALYQSYCSACHGDAGVSGGVLPDLRYSAALKNDQWFDITQNGSLRSLGMISFSKELSRKDLSDIRDFVIARANQGVEAAGSGKAAASRPRN